MDDEAYSRPPACYRCHFQKLRCIHTRHEKDCNRCIRAGEECIPRPSKRTRKSACTKLSHRTPNAPISTPPTTTNSSNISSEELHRGWVHDSDYSLTSNAAKSTFRNPPNSARAPGDHVSLWEEFDIMQEFCPVDFDASLEINSDFDFGQYETRPAVSATNCSSVSSPPASSQCFENHQETVINQIVMDGEKHASSGQNDSAAVTGQDLVPSYHQSEMSSPLLSFDKESQTAPGAWKDRRMHLTPITSSNTPNADSWACDLATLNVKLFLHKKSTSEAIRCLQYTKPTSQQSPRRDTGPGSMEEPIHEARDVATSFFLLDETLRLALELLRLLEELSSPITDSHSDSVPLSPNSPRRLATVSIINTGMNTQRGHIHVDQASRILLLSCYTCLLASLCQMFICLQLRLNEPNVVHAPERLSSYLQSTFPSIEIGSLSLELTPKLRAIMVLDLAERLVDDMSMKFRTTLSTRRCANGEITQAEFESRSISSSFQRARGYDLGNDNVDNTTWEAVRTEHDTFSRHATELKQTLAGA